MSLSLGIDTGGTFTDAVLLDADRRVLASAKSLTTPTEDCRMKANAPTYVAAEKAS